MEWQKAPTDHREMVQVLKEKGYWLERTNSGHFIYLDERGHRVILSPRANPKLYMRIMNDIRRGYTRVPGQQSDEELAAPRIHNEKHAEGFANKISFPVALEPEQPSVPELTPGVTPTPERKEPATVAQIKEITPEVIQDIVKLYKNGTTQRDIAALLDKQGFTTSTGKSVDQTKVSRLLRQEGLGRYTHARTKGPPPESAPPQQAPPKPRPPWRAPKDDGLLHEIQDLLTSNLSDELKRKFIVQIVRERYP